MGALLGTRLSFDELSNIVFEGVGDGPLKTGRALESAAKGRKLVGHVELRSYLSRHKQKPTNEKMVQGGMPNMLAQNINLPIPVEKVCYKIPIAGKGAAKWCLSILFCSISASIS